MCGITGYWANNGSAELGIAKAMACRIKTRGPDDSGVWMDDVANLVLAHRRLSILDLSPAGHQPMKSSCERYILTFNGEIYNHHELRHELESQYGEINWRGHSDTETLLAALSNWNFKQTLQKLNGMFAFAFWDRSEKTLLLARDRMGEKPLYYGSIGNTFLFGSELKALKAHPKWEGEIDRDALALFLRHSYVPTPRSIYRNIYKLPAAHYVSIRHGGEHISEPCCYWNLGEIAEANNMNSDAHLLNKNVLIDELDTLLRGAVSSRMQADVPLGAFLSGGYDSTMVVAQMQAQSNNPVRTFSIGFNEKGYDEAQHAKAVAHHLGTEHTELYITSDQAMSVIPMLPEIWDEPFADPSQIPTYLVSELAKQYVTVSLSGDGGDELFCGYNRYVHGYNIWNKLKHLPLPMREMLADIIACMPGAKLDRFMRLLPKQLQVSELSDRLPKLAEVLKHKSGNSFYRDLVSHCKNPNEIVIGGFEPETLFNYDEYLTNSSGIQERMMYLDAMTYLPDDILTKVDRASMAVSLEARVPLLDHRLVEFSWRVPMSFKYRNGQGKWIFREVLRRYVPKRLMERPKMGFGVPIEHWLRGPLRDWAETLLEEKRLSEEGFFKPEPIRKMWREHASGKRRWHYNLWDILMFQAWNEANNSK